MNGRILKIKTGYNPNSSSIGVDMVIFFSATAAITVLFNTLAAIISAAQGREQAPEGEAAEPCRPAALVAGEEQG